MPENTDANLIAVHAALQQLDETADWDIGSFRADRQGGLTNMVYKVTHPLSEQAIIVRLPGKGTEAYIDREIEAHNARMAAKACVSAEVLLTDPDTGLMISRCIPGITTMTATLFATRTGSPARAGLALQKLHNSGVKFKFHFELFAMIDEYLAILANKNTTMPDGYHDIVEQAQPIKAALQKHPVRLAPCHCDPLCENFLDDGTSMWIVDWEYSGMNDPYWDLGDLSVEGAFTPAQDEQMMHAYCQGQPHPSEMARMVLYKAMCDLLWTLWGLIQHADDNPAEDFWAYATERFNRCKELMQDNEFNKHIEQIAAYPIPRRGERKDFD